jgi:hypothetical protein
MVELLTWWIDFFAVAAQGENFDEHGFDALLFEPPTAKQDRLGACLCVLFFFSQHKRQNPVPYTVAKACSSPCD